MTDRLKQLKPEPDGKYIGITKNFLSDPEFLKLAYFHIKNKPGNLTSDSGEEKVTLGGINNN